MERQKVADFVRQYGGQRTIQRILIASNGIAALKCIRSMRRFSYEMFGSDSIFHFIVMATPEDVASNAEYIHMADQLVEVPGGSNNNNYANIHLITKLALTHQADAVWAGWGHASENPELCDALTAKSITWIGPTSAAMRALGDKVSSMLIAQSAGVACVPWSGSNLDPQYVKGSSIHSDIYNKACAFCAADAERFAVEIGFPVMVKASEGGGGKGIRHCNAIEEVASAFRAVQAEVPGSPIFLMRMVTDVRHLEVQLLADEWGNAISLFGRDCSIQRRHQKIIEEGPVVAAPASRWAEIEKCAVQLAKTVGYVGAGTVEILYDEVADEFAFLELNPRLQVEHTVTELISGVNLPAAQLQVAMGIPLYQIAEIRHLFVTVDPIGPIDFETCVMVRPACHVIACRITAENPEKGFQPTSGSLEELNFRSTSHVWGYFSIGSGGGIHEFADSQFGHLFSVGKTRELARLHMSIALKELSVRGEINTTVEYLQSILETKDFKENRIHTRWLETQTQTSSVVSRPNDKIAVILSSSYLGWHAMGQARRDFIAQIQRGRLIDEADAEGLHKHSVSLNYCKFKYNVMTSLTGPSTIVLNIGNFTYGPVEVRELVSSKGLLLSFEGRTYSVYGLSERPLRVSINGQTVLFDEEVDITCVRAQMSGRFLRYVVEDHQHITKGQTIGEMEVMKMYIPLLMPADGVGHHVAVPASGVNTGDVIMNITLDNPDLAGKNKLTDFSGCFPMSDCVPSQSTIVAPKQVLLNCLDGFDVKLSDIRAAISALMLQLRDPLLPVRSLNSILSSLHGRMHAATMTQLQQCVQNYRNQSQKKRFSWEIAPEFPAQELLSILDAVTDPDQFVHSVEIRVLLSSYLGGNTMFIVRSIDELLQRFLNVEERFVSVDASEAVVQSLLSVLSTEDVARLAISHRSLSVRCSLIAALLETIESEIWPLISYFKATLVRLANCNGKRDISVIALAARRLLTQLQLPPLSERVLAVRALLEARSPNLVTQEDITDCLLNIIHNCQPADELRRAALTIVTNRLHASTDPSIVDIGKASIMSVHDGHVVFWAPNWETCFRDVPSILDHATSSLHLYFMADASLLSEADDTLSAAIAQKIASASLPLVQITVGIITPWYVPRLFTYSVSPASGHVEDRLIRGLEPSLSQYLELDRLSNYTIKALPTTHQSVRIFSGTAPEGQRTQSRLFARCIFRRFSGLGTSRDEELHKNEAEAAVQEALQAVEVACDPSYRNNHVFLNFLLEQDQNEQAATLFSLFEKYATTLTRCRVTSAEVRIQISYPQSSKTWRYICNNPTGLILVVDAYTEDSSWPPNYVWQYTSYIATKGDISRRAYSSTNKLDCGALDGLSCISPYALQDELDARRRIAQVVHTLLPYDFLSLFHHALRCLSNDVDAPFSSVELCRLEDATNVARDAADSPDLHRFGLCAVSRPAGLNNIGMVGWLCRIYSGVNRCMRDVVIISNDITFQIGSFGVAEDELFLRCSRYARHFSIPRVYIACNSGARIGLSPEIDGLLKVDWIDPDDHRKGFNYLYLDGEGNERCGDTVATRLVLKQLPDGTYEDHYRLEGVIGRDQSIGVENLAGSGAIAGETSAAYNETFTLSYCSTRSVGIGAYLLRLGQRVIQKAGGLAPIILTGFGALNKILGSNVYKSNRQLGGSELMAGNGITHQIVSDDMEGVRCILQWLDFVPLDIKQVVPCSLSDSVDRPLSSNVDFTLVPYDPRILLRGDGQSIPGLFDHGSFVETLSDWARTSVCGRARLGGMAVGVIAVETRSQNKITPPDPVLPESCQSSRSQPGCVLFPDSAFKIAQCLRDFNQENIPIIIMANWRGFSGGQLDMHDEVLKYGAMIVDALRECHVPVIVYLPPGSELRGGAWVVVDRNVNRNSMEMYADPTSRGGVMEPTGIIDVKFRSPKVDALACRLNPSLLKDRQQMISMRPVYTTVAEKYAALHDTPHRMLAVKAINGVIPWHESRRFFYWRIRRRLLESSLIRGRSRAVLLEAAGQNQQSSDDLQDIDLLRIVIERVAAADAADGYLDVGEERSNEDAVVWLENNEDAIREKFRQATVRVNVQALLSEMDESERCLLASQLNPGGFSDDLMGSAGLSSKASDDEGGGSVADPKSAVEFAKPIIAEKTQEPVPAGESCTV
uniref:Uncharacterized protein n=1 Tax=Spongospora subterranea TaxID=70186 RepID=A0A0H5QWF8_9EUKA|eukprot:CRZ06255.1 hypothetical protein [Spongospora subterranea]